MIEGLPLTRPRAIEGFVEAELVRGLENPADYLVIGRWADAAAYAAWQACSMEGVTAQQRQALLETLVEELIGVCFSLPPVEACRVRITKPDIFPEAAGAGVEIFRRRPG